MLEIINENRKIFGFLLVVAIIIIIIIIWIPEKDIKLSKYDKITEEEIDKKAIKQYGDELQFAIYSGDSEFLKNNVVYEYLDYTGLSTIDYYDWLVENNVITSNISLGETTKYEYGNKNIYSIEALLNGIPNRINIIEEYPERWKYTFGTFVNYISSKKERQTNDYGVVINNIYQDINYISFNISLNIVKNYNNYIDLSKSDSIKLIMSSGNSIIMATNDYTSEENIINGRTYITSECIFNLPISDQNNISSIKFDSFVLNGEEKSLEISLDF